MLNEEILSFIPARILDILHLLAHLFDQHVHIHRVLRGHAILRLRAQRVGFAVQLLHQKVEPPADRFVALEHVQNLGDMGIEPIQFFVNIEFLRQDHEFLL